MIPGSSKQRVSMIADAVHYASTFSAKIKCRTSDASHDFFARFFCFPDDGELLNPKRSDYHSRFAIWLFFLYLGHEFDPKWSGMPFSFCSMAIFVISRP